MHVGSLHVLELPERYRGDFYEDVKAQLASRLHVARVLHRKLASMPFDLADPVWIEDEDIDIDYHVRRVVLPKPGTMAQLEALAARLHSSLLDRSRPLWEAYVIEGLQDGRVAYYSKVHHSGVDGKAGVELAGALFDTTPDPRARGEAAGEGLRAAGARMLGGPGLKSSTKTIFNTSITNQRSFATLSI